MSEVRVKENESLESALKRFKRQCARAGVMAEVRKREHYEKPSVKRKKKSEAARKRKFAARGQNPGFGPAGAEGFVAPGASAGRAFFGVVSRNVIEATPPFASASVIR